MEKQGSLFKAPKSRHLSQNDQEQITSKGRFSNINVSSKLGLVKGKGQPSKHEIR